MRKAEMVDRADLLLECGKATLGFEAGPDGNILNQIRYNSMRDTLLHKPLSKDNLRYAAECLGYMRNTCAGRPN